MALDPSLGSSCSCQLSESYTGKPISQGSQSKRHPLPPRISLSKSRLRLLNLQDWSLELLHSFLSFLRHGLDAGSSTTATLTSLTKTDETFIITVARAQASEGALKVPTVIQ